MIDKRFLNVLHNAGVDFFTGVPIHILTGSVIACLKMYPMKRILSLQMKEMLLQLHPDTISVQGKFRWYICRIPVWGIQSTRCYLWQIKTFIVFRLFCLLAGVVSREQVIMHNTRCRRTYNKAARFDGNPIYCC